VTDVHVMLKRIESEKRVWSKKNAAKERLSFSGVRRKFSWGRVWFRVIWWSFVFGVLFMTSQFDVISMFPNERFGEVC